MRSLSTYSACYKVHSKTDLRVLSIATRGDFKKLKKLFD